jgi:membrane-associated protease RseP (regulator of RpoE activity)
MVIILVAIALFCLIDIFSAYVFLILLKVGISEISFGMGPVILKKDTLTLRLLPFSGFVQPTTLDDSDKKVETGERVFDSMPWHRKVLVFLSGPTLLLVLCYCLIGCDGVYSFLLGFGQILRAAFSPLNEAQVMIGSSLQFIESHSVIPAISFCLTKVAAFNCLPVPPLKGGMIVASLLPLPHGPWFERFMKFSLMVYLLILLSLLVAIAVYSFSG